MNPIEPTPDAGLEALREAINEAPAPPTLGARITGSTGEAPIQDGTARGAVTAAIIQILGVILVDEAGILDHAQLLNVVSGVVVLAFLAWGVYDRWRRSRQ